MERNGLLAMIVNLSLAGFSLSAVVNFVWLNNDTVNFALLLTSGMLINVHSIVSTVRIVRLKDDVAMSIDNSGFHCIVAGCFVLLLCQIFDYLYGKNAKSDFLSTIGTSCMSFFSTFLLYVTSLLYRYRRRCTTTNDEDRCDCHRGDCRRTRHRQQHGDESSSQPQQSDDLTTITISPRPSLTLSSTLTTTTTTTTATPRRKRDIVFLEGTCGLQKQRRKQQQRYRRCQQQQHYRQQHYHRHYPPYNHHHHHHHHHSRHHHHHHRHRQRSSTNFDLSKYLSMFHGFADKHRLPYVQSMYETLLHTDLIWQMFDRRYDRDDYDDTKRAATTTTAIRNEYNNQRQQDDYITTTTTTTEDDNDEEYFYNREEKKTKKKKTDDDDINDIEEDVYDIQENDEDDDDDDGNIDDNDDDEDDDDNISCERCIVSQFAYSLLFHFDGARKEPLRFARAVDEAVFNDHGFRNMIAFVYGRWFDLISRVSGDRRVRVEWLIARDTSNTAAGILAKHSLELVQPDWNLTYYIANQNHIFGRLKNIIGHGQLRNVRFRETTTTSNGCGSSSVQTTEPNV